MVTTVIRYHWLPTLRTCTNFHSSLICIKCQSFQSFIKLLFFLHMYMYWIFKKGFCSTCLVFEYLVSEYGNLIIYSSFGFQNSKSCGFQNSKSCVCRLQKKKWMIMFSLNMWKYQIDFNMYLPVFIFSVFNNHFVK